MSNRTVDHLAARLTRSRESLDAVAVAARERAVYLRAEQARTNAVLFEAEHAHRLAAVELQRSTRARHLMAYQSSGQTGPDVPRVTYREPELECIGKVAPRAHGLGYLLERSAVTVAPRHHRLGRWLAGLFAAGALLCLAPEAQARPCATPLSARAVAVALEQGHRDVFGRAASPVRLRVARAQVGLEVGHGRHVYGNNLGNIGGRRGRKGGTCLTRGGFRVARYASPREGARAYWRLRAVRRALPWFDRGDARGAALALGRAGYYTAEPEVYAGRMVAVWRGLDGGKGSGRKGTK